MKLDVYNIAKYLVFFLLLFYNSQGVFFPSGLMISKVVLGVILVIEVICLVLSFSSIKKSVVNAIFLLVLLNIIYYLLSDKQFNISANVGTNYTFNSLSTWSAIKEICFNLMFFFVAFYLSQKNKLIELNIKQFFFVFYALAVMRYFVTANSLIMETGSEYFTSNSGYSFVHLLPFLFLIKRKDISIILLFISLGFIMFSAKRGAIIIGVLFSLQYVYNLYIKNAGSKLFSNIFIAFLILFIASFFVYDIYLNNIYLQSRLESTLEGDSSGRDFFYSQMWNYWSSSSNGIWTYLFGFGFAASAKISGLYAHNDWLELLTMSGVLGVVIYIIFFIQLFKFSKNKLLISRDKNILYSIILVWFFKTLFSMGYNDSDMVPILILLGYIIGKYNRVNSERNIILNS